ncbi:hypothetical protein H0H81_008445 [Sphagnurus paluster]|uniref:Fungal-type protein kinase domain-containing protein n=1 Tax=Sphagnurus paluster TaxID=117069 RepID=A0A9P7FXA9_9AGAR|nr:hypothetical protein H0H81_008445 [Sphagnurus paluster]
MSISSLEARCLTGGATSVCDASGGEDEPELVCKVYHLEMKRPNEGETLKLIYKKVQEADFSTMKPLSYMDSYGDTPSCTTSRVKTMLRIDWERHRTIRVIACEKLQPITSQIGRAFMRAWLEVVKCHALLWSIGVRYGKPSLWNIMYSGEHKCGVLTDFDLSILNSRRRVPGTDRKGTKPFMAIELLSENDWQGNLSRQYHHELKPFVWILAFVCFRYQDGKELENTIVDSWMTGDPVTCKAKKLIFAFDIDGFDKYVVSSFKHEWQLAKELVDWVTHQRRQRTACARSEDEDPYYSDSSSSDSDSKLTDPLPPPVDLPSVWEAFVRQVHAGRKFKGLSYLRDLIKELGLKDVLGMAKPDKS